MTRDQRALISLVVVVPAAILSGFVISILWGWYMAPLGLPSIGIAHAIGIDILVSSMTRHVYRGKYDTPNKQFKRVIEHSCLHPLVFLLAGWIAHFWI